MAKGQKAVNEERTTAASYIITFYKEVQELSHNFVLYENIMLELNVKYKNFSQGLNIEQEDKDILIKLVQTLRYHSHKCMLQYQCIIESIEDKETKDDKEKKESEELYKKIKETFIIEREDIYLFVKFMNKFLIKDIMKHLLEDSQTALDNIYKE